MGGLDLRFQLEKLAHEMRGRPEAARGEIESPGALLQQFHKFLHGGDRERRLGDEHVIGNGRFHDRREVADHVHGGIGQERACGSDGHAGGEDRIAIAGGLGDVAGADGHHGPRLVLDHDSPALGPLKLSADDPAHDVRRRAGRRGDHDADGAVGPGLRLQDGCRHEGQGRRRDKGEAMGDLAQVLGRHGSGSLGFYGMCAYAQDCHGYMDRSIGD